MDMSSSDVKIEKKKKANCSKSIHTSKQPYVIIEKTKLTKACSLNKENSRELLDCWLLFHLFCRLGSGFE